MSVKFIDNFKILGYIQSGSNYWIIIGHTKRYICIVIKCFSSNI